MNKAHFLPRNPHKSKKLEGYLDFLCAFQLKQRNKLPEIYVTLQGQLGPLFPDSQWMEGRQRMLTLLCKGRLGGSSSMDFWDIFLGGCLCFKIRWTFMFVTFGYMWKKVIHSQKKVKQKTVSKKENRCFSFKECLVILGFFSLADLLFLQSDDPWVFWGISWERITPSKTKECSLESQMMLGRQAFLLKKWSLFKGHSWFFGVSGYVTWIHRVFLFKDFADSANDQATLATLTLNFWGIYKYHTPHIGKLEFKVKF